MRKLHNLVSRVPSVSEPVSGLSISNYCEEPYVAEHVSRSTQPCPSDVNKSPRRNVAELVNTLRDHHLPESVCSSVLSHCEKLVLAGVDEFKELSDSSNVATSSLPTIRSLNNFRSQHKFLQYVNSELPHIAPQTIRLGENDEHSYQYVSLLDQIREIVKLGHLQSDIFEERPPVVSGHRQQYVDVFDGAAHPLREKDVVYLAISYDDFEVVNPLGTAATHHKVAALHFSVLNVPVESRSKVDSLFLLILCLSSYVKTYGWRAVLEPLIRDLVQLADGIQVFINDSWRTIRGKLLFVCGDNLALHSLGGFVESFSSPRAPCRFCLALPDEWQNHFSEADFVLRDKATYDAQLQAVIASNYSADVISDCGIKAECAFSVLPGFHVVESFPPDIAHDILIGVIPYTISLVLTTIFKLKYASVAVLNERVARFPWRGETNKPSFLRLCKGKVKVKQTASQAWTLLRYLPILLGDLVPETCEEWVLLTDLCVIVESLFAWKFTLGDIEFLGEKISEWLCALKHAYPTFKLKPKFHFMAHYASQIKAHGPLRHCWTMRYESKYSFLKGLIKENKNFRNIAKTIAQKHQVHMAFKLQSKDILQSEVKVLNFDSVDDIPDALISSVQSENTQVGSAAKVCGTTFEKGQAVMIQHEDYEFGEVRAVCIHGERVRLVLRMLRCVFFKHINAYELAVSDEWAIIDMTRLRCHKPCVIFEKDACKYVVVKSYA